MTKIFLSSVVNGFEEYRDAAATAIDFFEGFKCVRMEQFAASSVPALETCLQHLRQCDFYVGILGARYGSLHGPSGRSYTEAEYDEAGQLGIPRLMFLASVGPLFVETADCMRLQKEFRDRVSNDLFRGEFQTPDGLRAAITQSLGALAMKSEPNSLDSKTVTWLFVPFVTCQAGYDTGVAITNPDLSSLGIPARAGKCSIFYTGEITGAQQTIHGTGTIHNPSEEQFSLLPIVQESAVVPPGRQLTFVLTTGGNYGIAATPGFQGYLLIRCDFPNARGVAFTYNMIENLPSGAGSIPVEVIVVP